LRRSSWGWCLIHFTIEQLVKHTIVSIMMDDPEVGNRSPFMQV
jgi:hypothetical protein